MIAPVHSFGCREEQDDDGDVRENHEHAIDRSQMMKTMFRGRSPLHPCTSRKHTRTHTLVPVSVWREHFTVTGNLSCCMRRGKKIRVTQHTKGLTVPLLIIRTADIKQDAGPEETVAMVAGQSSIWGHKCQQTISG